MDPRKARLTGRAIVPPSIVCDEEPLADSKVRLEHIAVAAYYKAQARGFVPGLELDDWLDAEEDYDIAMEED